MKPGQGTLASHINDNRYEDAMFLLDRGEDISRVAKRLGLTLSALEKILDRKG